jgi:hypothetical protein
VYDVKSEFPRLFAYHKDYFYIITDEFEIIKLEQEQNKMVEVCSYYPRQADIDASLIK